MAQWDLHASGGFDYLLASPADHRLYVAQSTPDKYTVRQTIETSPGARTMELESTGIAYVIAPLSPAGQLTTARKRLKIYMIAP